MEAVKAHDQLSFYTQNKLRKMFRDKVNREMIHVIWLSNDMFQDKSNILSLLSVDLTRLVASFLQIIIT
jgi:hypothetical protein